MKLNPIFLTHKTKSRHITASSTRAEIVDKLLTKNDVDCPTGEGNVAYIISKLRSIGGVVDE